MKDDAVSPIIKDFINSQNDIVIDRYVGKGAFGELYFGQRTILGDRVALKFYQLENTAEDHIEPILLKAITHDNILPIIDAKVIDNKIAYYLTPEISGGDLQNIIDKFILKTDVAVNIIQGVLMGLNELHKEPRNLVHRDLKTLNILVDKNNAKPYLADFGTVKQIPNGQNYISASKFTFLYCPAEALLSYQYYKQSDIYQVGIILYQALGGFFPMKDPIKWLDTRAQNKLNSINDFEKPLYLRNYIEKLIISGKILKPASLPLYVNNKMIKIIKCATNVDINKRYKNCSEFLKALYEYQKNAKSWWIENDIIHSSYLKKNVNYRIVKRKNQYVVEAKTTQVDWRKKADFTQIKNAVEYIDNI
ncbi:MAG: protein kinase [bacterium]